MEDTQPEGLRILVTGGAGFIGSNLANHLARQNEVIAQDSLYLGTPQNLDEDVEFVDASVVDEAPLKGVDQVYHLAALSSLMMHEDEPTRGARVNVEGFVNIVEAARKEDVTDVVYASTSSIYGSRTDPSSEDEPVEARTNYEASKLARERYADAYSNRYGMNLAGLRFFSVYQGYGGAEQHKQEYANVIAQFADDIAHGLQPELYGDGTQTRDFTHVDDVVRACTLAAGLDDVYNVGTGESYSFNTVVSMINDELGTDVEPRYVENPIPDHVYVHDTLADPSKIEKATGWTPEISFEEGIRRVCSQYK